MTEASSSPKKKPLLLLPDSLSSRIFFSCRIVQDLVKRAAHGIDLVTLFKMQDVFDYRQWLEPGDDVHLQFPEELFGSMELKGEDAQRAKKDQKLEAKKGFFPLAVRHSHIHGFNLTRMQRNHTNYFLNASLARPFPRSRRRFEDMFAWFFGEDRFVHPAIQSYMQENTSALIISNLQFPSVQTYLLAARNAGVPIVAYIGSWDHQVGKGVVYPGCEKYIVQNDFMTETMERYHNIPPDRVIVTGWPQTDVYKRPRPRKDFEALLASYGLRTDRPCVLVCGNSEGNYPKEPVFVERLIKAWELAGGDEQYSIVFRPHPRDIINDNWKRFGAVVDRKGVHVQAASYSDLDILALMLQHVNCVVTNAGTVLLDSLVNDRPVVCVLYDEGGEIHALNNITGAHYQDIMKSGAFYEARNFDAVMPAIDRGISDPSELAEQRQNIVYKTIGDFDGQASRRVVDAVVETVPEAFGL